MQKKLTSFFKPFFKALLLVALVFTLTFGHASDAWAASRGGGRMGGGSFRAPSRTYSAPRSVPRGGGGYYGGGYGYGGGGFGFFGFPWLFLGGGFGSLFGVLIFIAIANFLFQSFRQVASGDSAGLGASDPAVSVAKVQVGLLSEARSLQTDLDRIATKADTSSTTGLAQVLQETTLALLRHPEYWIYAAGEAQQTRLEAAEAQFNRLALSERSKFTSETLSNVNSNLKQAALVVADPGGALAEAPGEFIVVTLVVGAQGKLQLPKINNTEDLRKALSELGSVSGDRLLALEVLWTPQASGDVLTRDDMLADYADLKLI